MYNIQVTFSMHDLPLEVTCQEYEVTETFLIMENVKRNRDNLNAAFLKTDNIESIFVEEIE